MRVSSLLMVDHQLVWWMTDKITTRDLIFHQIRSCIKYLHRSSLKSGSLLWLTSYYNYLLFFVESVLSTQTGMWGIHYRLSLLSNQQITQVYCVIWIYNWTFRRHIVELCGVAWPTCRRNLALSHQKEQRECIHMRDYAYLGWRKLKELSQKPRLTCFWFADWHQLFCIIPNPLPTH